MNSLKRERDHKNGEKQHIYHLQLGHMCIYICQLSGVWEEEEEVKDQHSKTRQPMPVMWSSTVNAIRIDITTFSINIIFIWFELGIRDDRMHSIPLCMSVCIVWNGELFRIVCLAHIHIFNMVWNRLRKVFSKWSNRQARSKRWLYKLRILLKFFSYFSMYVVFRCFILNKCTP